MDPRAIVTIAIVLGVYALLAIPAITARFARTGHPVLARVFSRPGLALLGGVLVLALGLLSPRAALAGINWRTLALLLGMMLLVSALERANVFEVIASRLARRFTTPARLLVGSMVVVAVLSALVLNDAVVLLFTPVLVQAARSMRVSPFPFLAAEAFAANLGSAATPIGNPQNAAIALARDLSFVDFVVALAPLAAVCLAVGIGVCLVAFRKQPRAPAHRAEVPLQRFSSVPMAIIAFGAVALALTGFLLGPAWGIPLWASALGAGVLVALLSPLGRESPLRVVRGVDAGILLFFVGLFMLLAALEQSGIARLAADPIARAGSGGFIVLVSVLSNVVSNVPAVLLVLPGIASQHQALLLAVTSTLAGNLTFFGSAATIIVAETARSRGAEFDAGKFTLIGLPLGVLTLFVAWVWLG